jgi:hypothetical protein
MPPSNGAYRWHHRLAAALAFAIAFPLAAYGQRAASANAPDSALHPVTAAEAERRFALVIGNNAYRGAPLTGPIRDAHAMADALTELGFKVASLEDVDRATMINAIKRFVAELGNSESVGLFYFAGHGAQSMGKNFLIPVDAEIHGESDIEPQSVDLQYMLDKFGDMQSGMNILILDACRDNPFASPGVRRSSGLAAIDGPPGTLVAFAAAPGHVALEKTDANGIYTKNVLANIRTPGLPVEEVFKRVRSGVLAETGKQQVPWENTSLVRDFYFQGTAPGSGFKAVGIDSEAEAWANVESSKNLYDFIGFLRRFPESRYQADLLARINAILIKLKPAPPQLRADELSPLLGEAYLGFVMRPLNRYSADFFGLPKLTGVLVTDIDRDSVAERSGLRPGDIILRVNGNAVRDVDDALNLPHVLLPGEFIDTVVWRQRKEVTVSGVLTRAPLERLLTRVADSQINKKDYERARAFYRYLAETGYGLGQTKLGLMYFYAASGPADYALAETWLRRATLQGQTSAAAALSLIYQIPVSGLKNDLDAFHWAQVSAEAGVTEGATALALAYYKGTGTASNPGEALRWLRIAAEQGEPNAMFLLGAAYESGLSGLEKSPEEAKSWYRRASELGFVPAGAALQRLGDP